MKKYTAYFDGRYQVKDNRLEIEAKSMEDARSKAVDHARGLNKRKNWDYSNIVIYEKGNKE